LLELGIGLIGRLPLIEQRVYLDVLGPFCTFGINLGIDILTTIFIERSRSGCMNPSCRTISEATFGR
jgi:hypothetical protein